MNVLKQETLLREQKGVNTFLKGSDTHNIRTNEHLWKPLFPRD